MGCCHDKPAPAAPAAAVPAKTSKQRPRAVSVSVTSPNERVGEWNGAGTPPVLGLTIKQRKSSHATCGEYTNTTLSPSGNLFYGSRLLPEHVRQQMKKGVMPALPWAAGDFVLRTLPGARAVPLPRVSSASTPHDVKMEVMGLLPGVNIESIHLVTGGRILSGNVTLGEAGVAANDVVAVLFTGVRKQLDFSARGWDDPPSPIRHRRPSDDSRATVSTSPNSHRGLFEPDPLPTCASPPRRASHQRRRRTGADANGARRKKVVERH